jgi:tetratricopeptide (TPR) repeat protein
MDAAEKNPQSQRAQHNLGYYYEKINQLEKAVEHYERSLSLPMDSYGNKTYITHANLGALYNRTGHPDRAEKHLKIAIKESEQGVYWPAESEMAAVLIHKKEYKKALGILLNVLKYNPNIPILHHNLGLLLLRTNQPHAAVSEFKKALELGGDAGKNFHFLGISCRAAGNLGQALFYFSKAIGNNPFAMVPRFHLAELYMLTGRENQAEGFIFKGLSQTPPRRVFSELKRAYTQSGNPNELPSKSFVLKYLGRYYSKKMDHFSKGP